MPRFQEPVTLNASLEQWWLSGLPVGALLAGAVIAPLAGLGEAGSIVAGTLGLVTGAVLAGLIRRRAGGSAHTYGVS